MAHCLLDQVGLLNLTNGDNNVSSAMVHVAGSLLYLIKGSDQLQAWAVPREKSDKSGDEKESQNEFEDVRL